METTSFEPVTLPAPLIKYFGNPRDVFIVRLSRQPAQQTINECAWRARGQWDCNNQEGFAAYNALRDIISGESDSIAPNAWGYADYLRFRGRV